MKPINKLVSIWGFIILVILLIASCNPVKQVLKDKNKLDQVAAVVIRSGYCINDTTKVTRTDSVTVYVNKDSLVHDTVAGSVVTVVGTLRPIDTVFSSGARVRISSTGKLSVACPVVIVDSTHTVVKDHYIRDVAKEILLEKDIASDLDQNNKLTIELKATKHTLAVRTAQLWGLILGLIIFLVIKFYVNIKKVFPFLPF